MVLKYRFQDFAWACLSVGVSNTPETRCSSSSIIQLSNELLGALIGQCGSSQQRSDGNRPFGRSVSKLYQRASVYVTFKMNLLKVI